MTELAFKSEIRFLAESLSASGKVRLPLSDLKALWATAAPRLVGEPGQVAGLASALTELAHDGVIELPVTAWDTSTFPALPRSVTIPAARRGTRLRLWTQFPWCRELGWIASLPTLSDAQFDDLVSVNYWLADTCGAAVPTVPMRYRSVQLFNDEKRLENLARSSTLFGADRLSLELLQCRRFPPPLAAAEVGDGPDLLVVENSDPYWMAVEVLRNHPTAHPIGVVAWGCGKSFPAQTPTLAIDVVGRGPIDGTVWYWGDLDPEGLAIAVDAASSAAQVGGPPVRPATGLWAAMAAQPVQSAGAITWTEVGREWLGQELHAKLAEVRSARGRIAQEAIPDIVIAEWAATLIPHTKVERA